MSIEFKKKPRKDYGGYWTDGSGEIFVGRDWALQNEIDESKAKTKSRSCFRECRTCGCCSNSQRDASHPYSYDNKKGKLVNCIGCEPFRFHDCQNGWLRNARGDAEPFTEEMYKIMKEMNGKPLI